jgi:outer membrane lipoprotein SlyB
LGANKLYLYIYISTTRPILGFLLKGLYTMNTIQKMKILGATLILVALTGCASMNPGMSPNRFSGNENLTAQQVVIGQVVSVRPVTISAASQGNSIGGVIGGGGGAGIGAAFGGTPGAIIGGIVGAVGGSIIGGQVDHNHGFLITVQLQGNRLIAVTQKSDIAIHDGEKVQVISQQYSTGGGGFLGGNVRQVVRVEPLS